MPRTGRPLQGNHGNLGVEDLHTRWVAAGGAAMLVGGRTDGDLPQVQWACKLVEVGQHQAEIIIINLTLLLTVCKVIML